ncbi:tetratricopeptide repeat protein [Pseudoalteromonas sp. MMG022]|uniref:tetratricopeptide repeat protein n=1 Tax=Pseudoalteromonas sp. MMG022 TaxID=2909978 RepID=UPI001F3B3EAE|nr:tetratricopeptide repeat protein [Pseudoalteromonas sp. MMG022]MCF6436976.1 tetratricopeptide repeat protein [Pseudoalteromonas sp. MMG022]
MSTSKTEKLISFWRYDKTNKTLLGDMLSSLLHQKEYPLFAEIYPDIPFSSIDASALHAQTVELLIAGGQKDLATKHLSEYQIELGVWHDYFNALLKFKEADYAQCIEIFKNSKTELSAMSYPLFARAYYISGQVERAIQVLEKHLSAQATPEGLGLYAMCLLDTGDRDKAEHFAVLVLQQSPAQLDALLALTSCQVAKHDFANAHNSVRKCLEINPQIGRTWSLAGQIELYNGQYEQAVDAFQKAVTLMPDHIGTHHLFAWTYLILNEVDKASEQFECALALNPNFADSHAGLAIIALNKEQLELAQTLTKKALRLDPNSFTANYAQSLLAAHAGDEAAASQQIVKILDTQSDVGEMTYKQLVEQAMAAMNAQIGNPREH